MHSLQLDSHAPAQQTVTADSLCVRLPGTPARYYHHGWHSWSLAAWTDVDHVPPVQKPHMLHAMQTDPAYALDTGHHGSWLGAVEMEPGRVLLLGALGLDAHVALHGNDLTGTYESGSGPWFIAHGDEATVFAAYAAELGKLLGAASGKPAPRVWCSWYSLYTAIDERLLAGVIDGLGDLPFDVIQVDDGWQLAVGDWQPNGKFSSGMDALAGRIRSTGRRAGLWLAPLIAVRSSRLFREHRDWFLRDASGRLVSAGFNWGEQLYALDTSQPAVLDWLRSLMQQVRAWGFDYIKLDFLYGGALPGKRSVAREQAYRRGLQALRDGMRSDAYFVACGAPIIPSLGLCDALRTGPDVAADWETYLDAVLLHNPAIPGTRNAIRTVLHRLWLRLLVQPDPDVVYFRSVDCRLSSDQKDLLQSLALICGFKATSDLPQWLSPGERAELRSYLGSSPRVEQAGPRDFRIDGRVLDYREAMQLAGAPTGWDAVVSGVVGWLANHGWVLRINDELGKRAVERKIRRMKA